MSDLFAVIAVGDLVLHCVDFDRPWWYRPSSPRTGLVPHPDRFVADALLGLAAEQILDEQSATTANELCRAFDRDLSNSSSPEWARLRGAIYEATGPGVLYVAIITPEHLIEKDLARLKMPVTVAHADASAERLRP